MPDTFVPSFTPLFEGLRSAPTAPGPLNFSSLISNRTDNDIDAKAAADKLAREVAKQGLQSLE